MSQTTLKKENSGYNYKYTDLAQINGWCEANGIRYSQVITLVDGQQFISTSYTKDGKEYGPFLGAQVIKAAPGGKVNEAQIYGSGLTYARRYSLLMCFGLATDDDDAQCYTQESASRPAPQRQQMAAPKSNGTDTNQAFRDMMNELRTRNAYVYDNYMKQHNFAMAGDVPTAKRREVYNELKATIDMVGGNND